MRDAQPQSLVDRVAREARDPAAGSESCKVRAVEVPLGGQARELRALRRGDRKGVSTDEGSFWPVGVRQHGRVRSDARHGSRRAAFAPGDAERSEAENSPPGQGRA